MYARPVRLTLALAVSGILAGAPFQVTAQDSEGEQRKSILLVAAPHLQDPNFGHSVVLVMFPPGAGPGGVILNRPTSITLRDIWAEPERRHGRTDALYIGGPVQPDGLLFLFRMTPPPVRAWKATEDIYFSGDGELLKQLLAQTDSVQEQRFFAGYSGWAKGQLEQEVSRGDWYVLEVDPEIIYDTESATLWERMVQRATFLRVDRATFRRADLCTLLRADRATLPRADRATLPRADRATLLRVDAPQLRPERIAYH